MPKCPGLRKLVVKEGVWLCGVPLIQHRLIHIAQQLHIAPEHALWGVHLHCRPPQLAHAAAQVLIALVMLCSVILAHQDALPGPASTILHREDQPHLLEPAAVHAAALICPAQHSGALSRAERQAACHAGARASGKPMSGTACQRCMCSLLCCRHFQQVHCGGRAPHIMAGIEWLLAHLMATFSKAGLPPEPNTGTALIRKESSCAPLCF